LLRSARGAASPLPSARRSEGGVAALEFALILPALLIVVLGTITLAHAFIVRFMLSSAAYDAARTCALARTTTQACATSVVQKKLGNTLTKWCGNWSAPTSDQVDAAFPSVSHFEVRVNCDFIGGVGMGFLKSRGIVITTLRARAVMPH
jgi:Flp pilus assembly protein TadG